MWQGVLPFFHEGLLVRIMKFCQNCESWLELWKMIKLVKDSPNCEILSELWNLAGIVKVGRNHEICWSSFLTSALTKSQQSNVMAERKRRWEVFVHKHLAYPDRSPGIVDGGADPAWWWMHWRIWWSMKELMVNEGADGQWRSWWSMKELVPHYVVHLMVSVLSLLLWRPSMIEK